MIAWTADVMRLAGENQDFRRVVHTGRFSQLTLMNIRPGEDVGKEIHLGVDEYVHLHSGKAQVEIGKSATEIFETHELGPGQAVFINGGHWVNILNTGMDDLRFYLISAPPTHEDGTIHRTRADSEAAESREEKMEALIRGYAEAQGFGA